MEELKPVGNIDATYTKYRENAQPKQNVYNTDPERTYEYIWKILGILPNGIEKTENNGNISTLCYHHNDTADSLKIDKEPEGKDKTKYSTARCWACQDQLGGVTPERVWMREFAKTDPKDDEQWKSAKIFLNKIVDLKEAVDFGAQYLAEWERTHEYNTVKEIVLRYFDENVLDELNPDWETNLEYLVDNKEVFGTRKNPYQAYMLGFPVWYGEDYKLGDVRYHPDATWTDTKISTTKMKSGCGTGHFMPFYANKPTEFTGNPDKEFLPNLIANKSQMVVIVEGQKDMLAMNLLGLPAITIVGGAGKLAKYPEMFTNKNVYIIFDNDAAGIQGAEALGEQLAEYAKKVYVSTGFYKDMLEKEDAYDFFFKYKKTTADFIGRLQNSDNFKPMDKDRLAELRAKAAAEAAKLQLSRKAVKVNSFQETYSLPMHSLIELNAKLDSVDAKVSHNVYTKPKYKITNIVSNASDPETQKKANDGFNRIKLVIQKAIEVDTSSREYTIEDESQRHIIVSGKISDADMDIVEQVFVETNKKTDKAYQAVFKPFDATVQQIIKSVGKDLFITDIEFDKEHATDYTEMWISQDMDFEELSQSGGGNQQVYSVFMPSHKIKQNTKPGDKLTIIAGKLKRHKDNRPFLLGHELEYRDPIANFEMTDEHKASLDKFKFRGETYEELDAHLDRMYRAMRLEGPEVEVYTRDIWQTFELSWNSIRMFQTEDIQGNRHTTRGVLDTAIIGDSGTGKSNTGVRFMKVYGTGVSQEFSKATVKGLIGGSDVGNKNKINPGILPQNDKALVILDELSGMDGSETRRNIFAEMLDIRSKGSVLVTRVSDKVELTAHVRLIMVSNPIDGKGDAIGLEKYKGTSFWSAVSMLIGAVPSLNRFSFIHFPLASEMKLAPKYQDILQDFGGESPFTTEDWKNKCQWVWSRKEEHTVVPPEITTYISKLDREMLAPVLEIKQKEIGLYSEGRTKKHITNIAVAFAAATASTIDYETIIVKKVHVEAAVRWILRMYHEETGIPRLVKKTKSDLQATDSEIDIILGKVPLDGHSKVFNTMLTFGDSTPPPVKELLFDMYTELYDYATSENGMVVNWNNIKPFFGLMAKECTATGVPIDDYGNDLQGAWKIAMKKLGVIKENPRNDRQFVIKPKFLDIYTQIQIHREDSK